MQKKNKTAENDVGFSIHNIQSFNEVNPMKDIIPHTSHNHCTRS